MKKLTKIMTVSAILLSMAAAAGAETMNFYDVPEGAWFYQYVETAFNDGILNGKKENYFEPNSNMTLGEAAKIAASIHARQTGLEEEFQPTGEKWYDTYVDYCRLNGIIEDTMGFDWDKDATRAEMAYIFSRCDTVPYFINNVPFTDIPDVSEEMDFANEIQDLYNKGIVRGSNENYDFYPDSCIKRSEVAAIVARILDSSMRIELPKG